MTEKERLTRSMLLYVVLAVGTGAVTWYNSWNFLYHNAPYPNSMFAWPLMSFFSSYRCLCKLAAIVKLTKIELEQTQQPAN